MSRLRGLRDLVFDAIEDATRLVQQTHSRVAERAIRTYVPVEPLATTAQAVNTVHLAGASGVYAAVRAVTRVVHAATAAGTDPVFEVVAVSESAIVTPQRSDAIGTLPWVIDHLEGALNGFAGDKLSRRGNDLGLRMTLRKDGEVLPAEPDVLARAVPNATPKICVFVHGLCCTEWAWSLNAAEYYGDARTNFGVLLSKDAGYTPYYVRYNTGRHVSENGRDLSQLLETLMTAHPVPVEEIVLIGHSMGGLVSRSAAHCAHEEGANWVSKLRHVFCLGSPHLGAPLEQGVALLSSILRSIPSASTEVPAALLDARSAGIKDLRYGYTVDAEWKDRDVDALFGKDDRHDLELVDGVGYYFMAAQLFADDEHPLGQLIGDLLVRLPSACGEHSDEKRRIVFRGGSVFKGMNHFHLANHPEVYAVIRKLLAECPADLPLLPLAPLGEPDGSPENRSE